MFAKLDRNRQVGLLPHGEVTHPRTRRPADPRIPGQRKPLPGDDGLADFATWLTSPDNDYFAKAITGRLWQAMFGRGLVEPVDDVRITNPATHPELQQRLAEDFRQSGFQIRHTIRLIANSAAYARSHVTVPGNENDESFYSHATIRRLAPEVIIDALGDVTGVPEAFGEPVADRPATSSGGTGRPEDEISLTRRAWTLCS